LQFVYSTAKLCTVPGVVNVSHLSADDWSGGLVTGNGRQGAVCYGGPAALRVTVSHERLFLPVHEPLDPPATARIRSELRTMCYAGKFQDAADAVVSLAIAQDPRYAGLREADPFIGAATLVCVPTGRRGSARDWRRGVDHATGVVHHEWRDDAGPVRQEVFVSRADDVVVLRLSGSAQLRLELIDDDPPAPLQASWATPFLLRVAFPSAWPGGVSGYTVAARARVDSGHLTVVARTLVDPMVDPELPEPDYDALLDRHRPVHAALFDRCRLSLGDRTGAPTETLLARMSPELVERLFDAGRYAIISASGELPPNLQGVWSGTYHPAWRGGYTVDGNLPAALAAVCATGTPELLLPLFDLIERHLDDFRDNARRLYGLPGVLLPPHLTTHGRHNHFNARWCLTFWTAGAAWMARLYHEYWRYTGDEAFRDGRALPFMRAAAEFYREFVEARAGRLTFAPSYSPENSPAGEDGPQASVNATMDVAAVRGLFRDLGEADGSFPGYRVDPDGALAEWLWPGLPGNHAHRHASHLYGLWYEPDPELVDRPELAAAAAVSVRRRLAWWIDNDVGEMAFGLGQLGLAAAALGLAAEAYECLRLLATRYWQPNLVSTHNAGALFNVDICGAFPALVVAMLVQGRGDRVRLLPALPAAWPTGRIDGVLLRGGIRVDELSWEPGRVRVRLTGPDTALTVSGPRNSAGGDAATVRLRAGQASWLEMEA
jgi:hypothetical protein